MSASAILTIFSAMLFIATEPLFVLRLDGGVRVAGMVGTLAAVSVSDIMDVSNMVDVSLDTACMSDAVGVSDG